MSDNSRLAHYLLPPAWPLTPSGQQQWCAISEFSNTTMKHKPVTSQQKSDIVTMQLPAPRMCSSKAKLCLSMLCSYTAGGGRAPLFQPGYQKMMDFMGNKPRYHRPDGWMIRRNKVWGGDGGDTAPLICAMGTGCRWVVRFTFRPFHCLRNSSRWPPHMRQSGPELVGTPQTRKTSLTSPGTQRLLSVTVLSQLPHSNSTYAMWQLRFYNE
jgi:hypothetical protein